MLPWKLLLLAIATVTGAMLTAKYEASQYALQRKLSHVLLTIVRVAFGLLLTRMVLIPEGLWYYLFPLLLLAGIFAPSHRILLWWFRTHRYKQRIKWYYLGEGWYDSLTSWAKDWPRTRFTILCLIELTAALAAYGQLTP
jgi:hypothetical protein